MKFTANINRIKRICRYGGLAFGIWLLTASPAILAQGADSYTTEQLYCRQAWCQPEPKTECCWEYCALAACNKTAQWDVALIQCSPQSNAYLVCMQNTAGTRDSFAPPGIVGTWNWFTGSEVVITAQGTMRSSSGNSGTWSGSGTRYTLSWTRGGYVDKLTLSADGSRLEGTNQHSARVWATRK